MATIVVITDINQEFLGLSLTENCRILHWREWFQHSDKGPPLTVTVMRIEVVWSTYQ